MRKEENKRKGKEELLGEAGRLRVRLRGVENESANEGAKRR